MKNKGRTQSRKGPIVRALRWTPIHNEDRDGKGKKV